MPYVRLNGIFHVPTNECEFYNGTPKQSVKLKGFHLQYMKFMHKVLRLPIDNIGLCAPLKEIEEEIGKKRMKVYEYWPEKDLWDRFYPSIEPTIRTFDVSDESSDTSANGMSSSSEVPTTSQEQMPLTFIPANQRPLTMTTIEPPSEPNQRTTGRAKKKEEVDENGNEPSIRTGIQTRKRVKATAGNSKISKGRNKKRPMSGNLILFRTFSCQR